MLRVRCWMPMLLALLFAAACTDSPTGPDGERHANERTRRMVSCVDPVCYPPGECDPWLDLNWCEGGGGECVESVGMNEPWEIEITSTGGCTGLGDGGPGAGGTTLPPPEPQDTCRTGDPIVDSPDVSAGLRDLWARSNPDANLGDRKETAGWIVQTSTGYDVVPITTTSASFGCAEFIIQPPAGATVVGFVHTHPYQVDETILDCDLRGITGYTGEASDADRDASELMGNYFGRPGGLPGYIIDKDGYFRFESSSQTATPRLKRCGY